MTTAFNMLEETSTGPDREHSLSDCQKIQTFTSSIREKETVKYCISAQKELNTNPIDQQTFESFYSIMMGDLSYYRDLAEKTSSHRNFNVNKVNTEGRGRGHGGGRGFTPDVAGTFISQLCVYSQEEFILMTPNQKAATNSLKLANGWENGYTPPAGFQVDSNRCTHQTDRSISAMANTPFPAVLPPAPPLVHAVVPGTIFALPNVAGPAFSNRRGRAGNAASISSSIGLVTTINGAVVNVPIFDASGNRLN